MTDEVSFLPDSLRTESPEFLVWWTGTLGQAEWLITHTPSLRGRSAARKCPSNLVGIPDKLRPLLALEQPDLIVTRLDGSALLSVEITEQQEFGLNAQQRMARFWSAVACRVPSAYLLPLESYQIEEASENLASILDEKDPARKEVLLSAAVLPAIRGDSLWNAGIRSHDHLKREIESGAGLIQKNARDRVIAFWSKHVSREGPVLHLPSIPHDEHLHRIDGLTYKAYLRSTGMPTAMLLEWMAQCSEQVPTYPFKMQSERRQLFRTSGVTHTMEDKENPHLSFRNLPPAPSNSEIVSVRAGKDEIALFIEFADSVVNGTTPGGLDREMFTNTDEYFATSDKQKWRQLSSTPDDILQESSGDFLIQRQTLRNAIDRLSEASDTTWSDEVSRLSSDLIDTYEEFHLYKIKCGVKRGLADPYSGALAVRDVLFCRNDHSLDLATFNRTAGLIFMVDLVNTAAKSHTFVYRDLERLYRLNIAGGTSTDPQDQAIALSRHMRIDQLPKDVRCHLLFSDLVIVRRVTPSETVVEIVVGIAGLMRLGIVDSSSNSLRSLTP